MFRLPVVVVIICFILLQVIHTETFDQVLIGIIAGAIFYGITVTIPTYKQNEIAKNVAIDSYCSIKEDILRNLLIFLNKYDANIVSQSIRSYLPIRQHITQDNLYYVWNNLSVKLVKDQLFYLDQL